MRNIFKQVKSLKITRGIIWLLELIHGKDYLAPKLNHLRTLQHGTVGREVADMLDSKQYRLIPKFEDPIAQICVTIARKFFPYQPSK